MRNLQNCRSKRARSSHLGLSAAERCRGVVAASPGITQGVAYAAAIAARGDRGDADERGDCQSDPSYGAEIVLAGADYARRFRHAVDLAGRRHATLVHAFDDDGVIAGQGRRLEILEEPDVEVIVVPVGGGG
jgi:threonine dehydratase